VRRPVLEARPEVRAYRQNGANDPIADIGARGWICDDPAGNTWIMKGFELGLKPQRTYEQFMAAGPGVFKKLPAGWKARIVTLQQDNVETPEGGVAAIMSDEFFNVYDKTGPGMSNLKP
jgi:hypothetical protein